MDKDLCCLCEREAFLTYHHLIPKKVHKRSYFKKNYTKVQLQTLGIFICQRCHSTLHSFYSEEFLGKNLNTKDKILFDEKFCKYLIWAKKQK